MFDWVYNKDKLNERYEWRVKMKTGETMCYYRAPGGGKSIYVTMLYHKNQLRGSIIQNYDPQLVKTVTTSKKAYLSA